MFDWFVDGGHYLLPDGTPVRAVLVERDDDEWYWKIKDMEDQILYTFWEGDGCTPVCGSLFRIPPGRMTRAGRTHRTGRPHVI